MLLKTWKKVPVFTIKVIYKSGQSMEFKCLKFEIENGIYRWKAADPNVRPILLGTDEIAAVWQVGHDVIEVEADPNEGAQP